MYEIYQIISESTSHLSITENTDTEAANPTVTKERGRGGPFFSMGLLFVKGRRRNIQTLKPSRAAQKTEHNG